MIKKDLAKELAERMDISLFNAEHIIERVLRNMTYALRKKDKIVISNFGSFQIVKRNAKAVRNPRTHEMITVPEYNKIIFSASEYLIKELNTEL
jgi:nucleoid DNA-binding protein